MRSEVNLSVQRVPCIGKMAEAFAAFADRVFLRARGLPGSVATRYPMAFQPGTATIYVQLAYDQSPVSGMCRRDFVLTTENGRALRGTMIGLVGTNPDARGRGHASRILAEIENDCRLDRRDFMVLWSRNHTFFEGLGWVRAGHSLFGKIELPLSSHVPESVHRGQPEAASIGAAEHICREFGHRIINRPKEAWFTRPMQCDQVELVLTDRAYVLLGHSSSGPSVLFEMIGDEFAFEALWLAVASTSSSLFVNAALGGPSQGWLEAAGATLNPTRLAHWKRLGSFAEDVSFEGFDIPFFDRV